MSRAALEYPVYYTDTGCASAETCLQCPFPQCLEGTGGNRLMVKESRDAEIICLYNEGETIKDLATIFGVHKRTIQRAVR